MAILIMNNSRTTSASALRRFLVKVVTCVVAAALFLSTPASDARAEAHIAVLDMDMMILPGTRSYLEESINNAAADGAKAVIIKLDTPGGLLQTAQEMVQLILGAPIPVIVYVGPSGSTATSAGVFITLAGHVAAMAPGTTIGAATPVAGDGKDIDSDMKAKAENITSAMVRSIGEQRGRNLTWGDKAVKEAAALTEREALAQGVIDLVATDEGDLLRQLKGREVLVRQQKVILGDWSALPRIYIQASATDFVINVLANPNVLALLWLGASTGLTIELYNPGLIFPGVIGAICLILALAMSQIIPINQGAVLLLGLGALLVGAELYTGTILLGILGAGAMLLGALYLINQSEAPGLSVALEVALPVVVIFAGIMLTIAVLGYRALRQKVATGAEGMVGMIGTALGPLGASGQISVNGERWNAVTLGGVIEAGAEVEVVEMRAGLTLEVKRKKED